VPSVLSASEILLDMFGLVVIITSILSILSCGALMCKAGMPTRNTRLFPRLLWHLALADCLYCLASILHTVIGHSLFERLHFVFEFPTLLAVQFFTFYLSCVFFVLNSRSVRFAKVINKTVWLPWLLSLIVEIVVFAFDFIGGYYGGWVHLALAIMTGLTFLAAGAKAKWNPRHIDRVDKMVWLYFIVFLLTLPPWVIYQIFDGRSLLPVIFLSLNGLLNACCYLISSKQRDIADMDVSTMLGEVFISS